MLISYKHDDHKMKFLSVVWSANRVTFILRRLCICTINKTASLVLNEKICFLKPEVIFQGKGAAIRNAILKVSVDSSID